MDRKYEVKKEAEMDMELENVVMEAENVPFLVIFLVMLFALIVFITCLAIQTAGRVVDRVRELRQAPVEITVYPEPVCEACGKLLRDDCECAGMEGGSRDPSAYIVSH